ncbi:hypothetical protein [Anoxybacillus sp. FSL W8-1294]|uniref:hypothetical protein n=1 Tax=Anoxybacillus sp. FSL W8-1294 TaxID=2954655 RepID=UPI0030D5D3C4
MNLDRFAYGLRDPQSIPMIGECAHCHAGIFKGYEVIRYEGELFCDTHCLGEYLLEVVDYEEVIL